MTAVDRARAWLAAQPAGDASSDLGTARQLVTDLVLDYDLLRADHSALCIKDATAMSLGTRAILGLRSALEEPLSLSERTDA